MKLETKIPLEGGEYITFHLDPDHLDPDIVNLKEMAIVKYSDDGYYPLSDPLFNLAGVTKEGDLIVSSRYSLYSGDIYPNGLFTDEDTLKDKLEKYILELGGTPDDIDGVRKVSLEELREDEWWVQPPFNKRFQIIPNETEL